MPQPPFVATEPSASETCAVSPFRLRRRLFFIAAVVFALALAAAVTATLLVDRRMTQITEQDLQSRATALARTIDLRLQTYSSALDAIAESYSLRVESDLDTLEWEARRVGALFGGWFVLSRGGDMMDIQMSTALPEGSVPPPEPRSNYPELLRAEAESTRTGRPVVSDAFMGRTVGELIITTVKPVDGPSIPDGFLYFSVSLRDINNWLEEFALDEGEFAAIADGTRRVIARSQDNEDFVLAGLPEWYVSFSAGRDSGVATGPPVYGGVPRMFGMQRLAAAPGWTVAISRPVPSRFSAAYWSPWPISSALSILVLGGIIGGLLLGRQQARAQSSARAELLTQVRAADARKSQLMAVLAHDLRTPLIAMLGALDLFRADTEKRDRETILRRLKADGHGMLTLIDDVLELSRLGAGEARLRPERISLQSLLEQVKEVIRPSATRNGTEIVVQANDIPMVIGDVAALRRVMMNFATNAVKATRGGTIRLGATLGSAGPKGHAVTLSVTDTGCGIAPEDIPRLFRDFGMLERDGPARSGTGLGLAICRRLAHAMGGEVGVESELEQGSRFWLRVPLPVVQGAETVSDLTAEGPERSLVGMKVLVAEDHDLIRQLTCATLARAGMIPTEAADGETAVALAEMQPFDLILMDLQMPRLDGDAAATRIRNGTGASARARILCVTAHQSPEIALMLSDLAFDACIRKPLDLKQLSDVLQSKPPLPAVADLLVDFDAENIAYLRELGGSTLLRRTLNTFDAEIETAGAELVALINKRDTFGAARIAHKMVGLSDILGARKLSAKLRSFENFITDAEDGELHRAVAEVSQTMNETREQLQNLIHSLGEQK